MANFDFNEFSSLGVGSEAFAILEEDLDDGPTDNETVAEAEVKVSVDSGADQQDDDAADDAAESVETVSDAGAELFKDLQRLASIKTTLQAHDLHPSLYAFLNHNNQLDNLLQASLPAVESLSKTGGNADVKESINQRLDALFATGINGQASLKSRIERFFQLFTTKLQKLQAAVDTVVINRRARISDLVIRMEDESTPEEVEVVTDEVAGAPEESGDDAEEVVEAAANTAEECNRLMQIVNVAGLNDTALVKNLDAAADGDAAALKSVLDYTRNATRELTRFNYAGRHGRSLHFNKFELGKALENYYDMLNSWSNVNKLHYALGKLSKMAAEKPIRSTEDFSGMLPMFQTAMMVQNYIQTAKKAMDALYYNLQYVSTKLAKKRYR